MNRVVAVSLFLFALSGCGTYSVLRPADNLAQGRIEIQAGAAVNTIPELLPVLKADIGVTDWFETGIQWEVYNFLVGGRFGLLRSEIHGIALAVGAQAGMADIFRLDPTNNAERQWSKRFVVSPNLTVGRRFDKVEIYLGGKILFALSDASQVLTGKFGARWTPNELGFVTVEAGPSFHRVAESTYTAVGEATASIGVSF